MKTKQGESTNHLLNILDNILEIIDKTHVPFRREQYFISFIDLTQCGLV
jgi:hypothetical protein